MWKEIEVKGSFMYTDNEFSQAIDLFRQKKITTKGMISRIIPLEELPKMIEDLSHPASDIKVLVKP
jgi:threonine dehydrogenase-like Zn-dependent dehydrogenase